MEPRHVVAGPMRRFELGDNLIEAHGGRVDDARPVWTAREDVCAAEGEQVRRAGAGADEVHGHGITTRGFVALHWVTAIAGRKACLPPTASRRSTERRVSVPPNLCWAANTACSVSRVTALA